MGTIDFDLNRNQVESLYASGTKAANEFFERWDFAKWVAKYRAMKAPKRAERV